MNRTHTLRRSKLALGLIAALAAAPVFAQSTSAGVGGQVTGSNGQPVAGAEVVITHVESGTVSRATTDASGRYSARGLRVGGPYTIVVNKAGEGTDTEGNVYLTLDKVSQVDAQLTGGQALDTITVVGAMEDSVFSSNKMGTGSNVTRGQIEALPSIQRNIQDYVRLDPHATQTDKARNEISVGGQNPRYNAIRVDGISTNDSFGLESNSMPTPKQPFSMDVIDEIAVNVANYDVTIAGGVGGVINAVTKSGTNKFQGSVYGLYRDNKMVRKNSDGSRYSGFEDERTYGLTVGGPIIKDKLFFFFNFEDYKQGAAGPTYGPVGSGASNIVGITKADIAEVRRIATAKGFEAGNYAVGSADTTAREYGLKLDWNITDSQRASFRYSMSDQSQANYPGFGSRSIALNTYAYQRDFAFDNYTLQLFSDWSDRFSTEAKVSYREYSAVRTPVSNLPAIAVVIGGNTINLGTEENTHASVLSTETWNGFFAGNVFLDSHTLKFGVDYEKNDIYNLFGRRINGVYTFNGTQNFEQGISSRYQLFYPAGGNTDNMAAIWGLRNTGVFFQDNWAVNSNLTLQFGLRYDKVSTDRSPAYNACASSAPVAVGTGPAACPNGGFGYDNSVTIDGKGLLQPRLSFNYTFDTELPTQFRGGIGLFQGAAANVWLSNPYTNTGLGYTDYFFSSGITGFSADPNGQLALIPASARGGRQSIDFIDADLRQPSVWKANLGFETELPFWGVVGSAEVIFTEVKDGIYYEHLNLGVPTGYGPDGRAMFFNAAGYNPACYDQFGNTRTDAAAAAACIRLNGTQRSSTVSTKANSNSAFNDAIIARPTDKGRSQQFTLSLQKPFGNGDWSWMTAYTFTDSREVSPLTSSTSGSQWGYNNTFHPNEETVAHSPYEIRHRLSGMVGWRHAFFGDYKTSVSMFFEGRSGRRYSYTFDNDANGDARFGNDLLYIPAAPGDVEFGSAAEETAFWNYVNGNEYLRQHRGQVASRNGAIAPWVSQFDLRLSQEFPGFWSGHKSEVWLDVLNVGNLLNKKWGQVEEIPFPNNRGVVEYGGISPVTGKYVYRFNTPDNLQVYDDRAISRWSLQVGFRYKF